MWRYRIAVVLSAVLLVLVASPAGAGLQWCPRDPLISLNGQEVQIWVSIPEQHQTAVTGPIAVDVATPRGVNREVLFTDEGFNGHGETVTFYDRGLLHGDKMDVRLRISVPYDHAMVELGDLPVLLTVILPDGSVIELQDDYGRATMDFTIPAHP
ncbi:hypothetical protein BH23CHL2_BH23CHL2_23270 [soil metagenome]